MKLSLGMVLGATWRRPHLATSGQLELKLALLLPNAAHNAQEEAYIYIYIIHHLRWMHHRIGPHHGPAALPDKPRWKKQIYLVSW